MKKITIAILALAIFAGWACVAAAEDAAFQRMDALPLSEVFGYDKNLPFNIEKTLLRETNVSTTYSIYYDSAHDERVPAQLTIPKGEGPFPVIIFMHGHGMKKDLGEMGDILLGQKKYAMFSIDVKYRNERSRPGHDILSQYVYSSRDAFIQTIIDNMRGIDYLETLPEIDSNRIGVMGLSMGTFIGSALFSRDDRIRVAAFGVGGGNWRKVGEKSFFGPLYALKQSGRSIDEIFSAFSVVDPLNHVYLTKGRPVLMVNGRLDELVPAEAAVALYEGFQEPKRLMWFDGGHVPSMDTIMELVNDMFDYFNAYLKPEKYHRVSEAENTPPTISNVQLDVTTVAQNERIEIKVNADDAEKNIIFVKAQFDCGDDMAILYDDGKTSGDETKRDGIYTGRHRLYEKATLGKSLVHVVAVDRWGATSEELTAEIDVTPIVYPEGAHAPVITEVIMPEKARIGEKVHFEVHTDDADGDLVQVLVNIKEIGLTLAVPPGAGGVMSQDFSIPDLIPTGVYHFTFTAKDKTKMYSEVVEKVSEILPAE